MPRDLRLYSLLLLTACASVESESSEAPVVSGSESAVLMHCPPGEAPVCERKKGRVVCVCEPIDTTPPECTVSAAPLPVLGGGYYHSCENGGGTLKCWGMVPGSTGSVATATFVLPSIAAQMTGAMHDCAVSSGGAVACWGASMRGELGDGTNTAHDTPAPVVGLSDAISGDAGYALSCVVRGSGEVACWGGNDVGQVGDGTLVDRWTPSPVSGLSGVTAVSTSESGRFACALKNDGSVWCWGANDVGQLGSGTTGGISATPVLVRGLNSIVSISAGGAHACAVDCYGQVACWGDNANNRLGDSTPGSRPYPAVIAGLSATQVSAGGDSTCAVQTDRKVACWGSNYYGQLGTGDRVDAPTPVLVSGLTDVAQVSQQFYRTCAITLAGGTSCWGTPVGGSLGDGTLLPHYVPTPVIGLP